MKSFRNNMIDRYRQWLEFAGPAKFEQSVINLTGPSFKAETLMVQDLLSGKEPNQTNKQILKYINVREKVRAPETLPLIYR